MKKHVYRKGDKVRILSPYVVKRVGYPKSVYDYLPEETERELVLAQMLLEGLPLEEALAQLDPKTKFGPLRTHKVQSKIKHLAAYLRAKGDGFGGNARSIHYELMIFWDGASWHPTEPGKLDPASFKPIVTEVLSKRVVVTGDYYPPYYPQSSWDYDDYTPGGLENRKSHVIISTHYGEHHVDDIEPYEQTI